MGLSFSVSRAKIFKRRTIEPPSALLRPQTAFRWLQRFQGALETLDHNPERCPLARENDKVDVDVREFLFGKRPYVFRILFVIDGETVRVLRIRRAQRRFLRQGEIKDALESDE